MKSLTIAILNFNSGEYLKKCLESVKAVSSEADVDVYAIDNDSTDESFNLDPGQFSDVKFVKNEANLGFSKGYNKVLRNVKSEYILLLNPDCILKNGVIKKILEDFENDSSIGAATCKIILPDGKVDLTAHRGFPTPLASLFYLFGDDSLYHMTKENLNNLHEVDAIAGAFFMTKKSVLEKIGFLDERFFLYGEDIDLCVRIKKLGLKIVYDPSVEITHYKGISSGLKKHSQKLSPADMQTRRRALNAFYESMLIFYNKHYKKQNPFFINWLIYSGIYLKWAIARIKQTV